jgi:hypothetical protein
MSSVLTWIVYGIVFGALGALALHDRAKAKQAVKFVCGRSCWRQADPVSERTFARACHTGSVRRLAS